MIKNRYIKNVITALLGRNPFQQELEDLKKKCEDLDDQVKSLDNLYHSVVKKLNKADDQINSYQVLVENQRERLACKDKDIAELDLQHKKYVEKCREYIAMFQKKVRDQRKQIEGRPVEMGVLHEWLTRIDKQLTCLKRYK